MKILGKTGEYTNEYICTISHTELEKVCDKYFGDKDKIKVLKAGDDFNIAAGFDFRNQIRTLCNQMTASMTEFERAKDMLTKFALMIAEQGGGNENP